MIKQIEIGGMRKFALVSAADQAAARGGRTRCGRTNRGRRRRWHSKRLWRHPAEDQLADLCGVVGDKVEAHKLLILKNADKLTFDMRLAPVLAVKSAEDAFVGAQKAQCGAIYASAADLKTISEGLTRANIPFAFSSLWITLSELDAKDAEVVEKHRLEAQRAAEAAQDAADAARIADQQRQGSGRDLGGPAGNSTRPIRGVGQSRGGGDRHRCDKLGTRTSAGAVGVEYPDYAAWLAEMKADHWEIMTTDSDVQDYGTSDFKGRPLDTALARVKIRLKNAILGEYKDACFVFGRIADPEFNMTREPVVAACDDEGAIKLWQTLVSRADGSSAGDWRRRRMSKFIRQFAHALRRFDGADIR